MLEGHVGRRSGSTALWPYLQLMRPPNLATACADVLAGFAAGGLTAPQNLPWLLLATAALYAGGVVLNDVSMPTWTLWSVRSGRSPAVA